MNPRQRRSRRPIWSVRTIALLGVIVVAVTCGLTYLLGQRSLFVETEISLVIVAGVLFFFLLVGLYRGVRVRRRDVPKIEFQTVGSERITDGSIWRSSPMPTARWTSTATNWVASA